MFGRKPDKGRDGGRCAGCGHALGGGARVTALGREWHLEHFTCSICQKPVDSDFSVDGVRPVHEACSRQDGRLRCQDCAKPLVGTYQVDLWGLGSCLSCYAAGVCDYCGASARGAPLGDGRQCATCRRLAVREPELAQRLYGEVVGWAEGKRFFQNFRQPPMELYRRARMRRESGAVGNSVLGMAKRVTWETPRGLSVQAQKVVILDDLPAPLFQAVAAHELGHVWVAANGIVHITPQEEEGFCELLSHTWISDHCTVGREGLLRGIETSSDPVYGDGFRLMKQLEERGGLIEVMQRLVSRSQVERARRQRGPTPRR